jgi:hypothetical protein
MVIGQRVSRLSGHRWPFLPTRCPRGTLLGIARIVSANSEVAARKERAEGLTRIGGSVLWNRREPFAAVASLVLEDMDRA